jgi:16S rRNA C967 or C1407 C5-methylase (RsmB/RsmF family)/NOL1/NOP2/fmu family ribosome biogenesis protein
MAAHKAAQTAAHQAKDQPRPGPLALPPAFLKRMQGLLGAEYPAFLASYDAPASNGLRVNTLKLTPAQFRSLWSDTALAPFSLAPLPWAAEGFLIPGEAEPGKHPYHAAGLYYLQDPSAMAVGELLDPQPGERVLDLSAAPGGKATHLAARMGNQGLLVANEIHGRRVWDLAENLERWGARHAAIINESPERLAERFAGFFDRVLLDAPCSGEGMFRKGDAARREWEPALVAGCALRQSAILEDAAAMVRPGGVLGYSTCTFAPDEDEGSIARFLREHPDFALIEPPARPGMSRGRPEWLAGMTDEGNPLPALPELRRAVRLWPHLAPGEGHFIAIMRRNEDAAAERTHPWRPARLAPTVERAYRAFVEENLTAAPDERRLALVGSYLYALPPDLPDLTGLRFIHPGWWLGTIKKDRFEPSHALALGLTLSDAARCVDLPPDSAEVSAFLRGESFSSAGEDGWMLVGVSGFPLGWGKRVRGVVKSHYPRGLRHVG